MANCPRDDLYADISLTGAMNEHSGKRSGGGCLDRLNSFIPVVGTSIPK